MKPFRLLLPFLALLVFSCATPPPPKAPKESLLDLVENQNLAKIREIFGLNTNVDSVDAQGRSALHIAAEKDLSDIAAVLLSRGASVDLKDKEGKTPLMLAVEHNAIKTIPLLVQYKASLFMKDKKGRSPFQTALDQNPSLLPLLVTKDNIGSTDQEGNTPLHWAASRGSVALVQKFLALGADPSQRNKAGLTPADLALQFPQSASHAEIAWDLFRKGAPVPLQNDLVYFGRAGIADDVSLPLDLGTTPLHYAAAHGQTGIVEFLVKKGAVVDARDFAGNTPLHKALENGQLKTAAVLIKLGADVNLRDFNNNTALHLAMTSPHPEQAARLLLEHKADPNLKNNFGNTPLHLVVSLNLSDSLLKLLLEHGADINARNKMGETPLFDAVQRKEKALALALRLAGANIFAVNNADLSPVRLAVRMGQEVLSWLVDKSNIGVQDDNGNTALHLAVMAGNYLDSVNYLLQQGADPNVRNKQGQSPLHLAIAQGNLQEAQLLLAKGADLFLVDNQSVTPLQLAFQSPLAFQENFFTSAVVNLQDSSLDTPLFYAIDGNLPQEVTLLLQKGASLTMANLLGNTPLHEAVRQGSPTLVSILLQAGASPAAVDKAGNTPLQDLIWVSADQPALGNLLLAAGANLEAKNLEGRTVLDQAVRRGETALVKYLLSKNANPNASDISGRTPVFEAVLNGQTDLLAELLRHGGRVWQRDITGATPLHFAASQGNESAIRLLIQQGADPFAENRDGASPTSLALRSGPTAWKAFFTTDNVNNQNNLGRTALHLAVLTGAPAAAIKMLLSLGADPSIRDKNGQTPLDLAKKLNKQDLVAALEESTAVPSPSSATGPGSSK